MTSCQVKHVHSVGRVLGQYSQGVGGIDWQGVGLAICECSEQTPHQYRNEMEIRHGKGKGIPHAVTGCPNSLQIHEAIISFGILGLGKRFPWRCFHKGLRTPLCVCVTWPRICLLYTYQGPHSLTLILSNSHPDCWESYFIVRGWIGLACVKGPYKNHFLNLAKLSGIQWHITKKLKSCHFLIPTFLLC